MILSIKNNNRYKKAKYASLFDPSSKRRLYLITAVIVSVLGLLLIYFDYWFGWLVFIPVVLIFIAHEWWKWDLNKIQPINNSDLPEDIIKPELLAKLKTEYSSVIDLIDDISQSNDFWFIPNRFLLAPDYLKQLQVNDTWWQKAVELWNNNKTPEGLTAAHIIGGLVLTAENKNQILSLSNNKEEDILQAVSWFVYLHDLISSVNVRKSSGGIARDWAAGYTPLLNTYAQNISLPLQNGNIGHREISGHQNIIEQLKSVFASKGRQNCALVGDVGVGKNACVQAFAESILFDNVPVSIKYNQVYQIDIASVLTKVPENQIDYTIQRLCIEALSAKNIILYFDNAGSFFGLNGGPDLTNIILPIIEGGRVRMVFSFTTNQWQIIQKSKPAIVSVLNYQAVLPTSEHDTLRILENQTLFTEHENNCTFTYEGVKEVYRLADKYGPDISMPERAISVLEDVARGNQGGLIGKHEAQVTLEKITGIKIATVSTDEKQTLLSLEDELHKRVIGQNTAIKQIASALKRSRTGVANQNKPIGTFLFLGPTGVGKTEVSKTLANVYFGGSAGMVRLDMNEYITQDSIHRLLSSSTEHGSSFLESIKKKPFSVVLFDEIEKAHPDIVNVFLQLLDEGVIKDTDNKTISFKDSIVIATSNAGSDSIREKISSGIAIDSIQESIANELISTGIFKPEFINRFDDVIVFAPLKPDELRQIVGVLLSDLNQQMANQGITVRLTEDAIAWLANKGYDERLGARPLRRMMQKTVETAVSDILLEKSLASGSEISLNEEDLEKVESR